MSSSDPSLDWPHADSNDHSRSPDLRVAALRLLFTILLWISFFLVGGTLHLAFLETPGPGREDAAQLDRMIWLVSMTLVGAAASLAALAWLNWRRALLFAGLYGLTGVVALVISEGVARVSIPPWPAADLHGIDPRSLPNAPKNPPDPNQTTSPSTDSSRNSWGQRDRERTRVPAKGCRRIALIGDSFLEEGSGQPLSIVVEDLLRGQGPSATEDVEVINLGVSATGPDEYFYRLKNVALPLGASTCVMFVYLGNDLAADARTLTSYGGIAAVTPRQSWLTDCGLRGWNHLLTNNRRPVIEIWQTAGGLADYERQLHELMIGSPDEQAANVLLRFMNWGTVDLGAAEKRLRRPEMAPFYQMLREPDSGRFRSYFIEDGLWMAVSDVPPQVIDETDFVLHWLRQSAALCRSQGVEFRVALIPDGFSVDPRMQEMWRPLAEMSRLTEPTKQSGLRIQKILEDERIPVFNLTASLDGVAGAYLNLDGHWSETGVQRAAEAVASQLRDSTVRVSNP